MIENIKSISKIVQAFDTMGSVTINIMDTEGSLYTTWTNYINYPIKILDDNDNILFVGDVLNRNYSAYGLSVTVIGTGRILEDTQFNHDYQYFLGRIKTVVSETELDCEEQNEEGEYIDTVWTNDYWNSGSQDKGVLITNSATRDKVTWTATTLTVSGEEGSDETVANVNTPNDGLEAYMTDDEDADAVMYVHLTGTEFLETQAVDDIVVRFRWKIENITLISNQITTAYLMIYNRDTSSFEDITGFNIKRYLYGTTYGQKLDGVSLKDYGLTNLDNYVEDTGGDNTKYDKLQFRIRMSVSGAPVSAVKFMLDYIEVDVYYADYAFTDISKKITDTSNSNRITCAGATFQTSGVTAGDLISIGESTVNILNDASMDSGVSFDIDLTNTLYLARTYNYKHCLEIVREVTEAHNARWYETWTSGADPRIGIKNTAEFSDSGETLNSTKFEHDFNIEQPSTHVYGVRVWGNASLGVEAIAVSSNVPNSYVRKWYTIINDGIMSKGDAKQLAILKLAELETQQLAITLTLKASYPALKLGTYTNITFERPTIAAANYPLRYIEREQNSEGIMITKTSFGLASTSGTEKLGKLIRKMNNKIQETQLDRIRAGNPATTTLGYHTHSQYYTGPESVAAVEAKDPLNLTGEVTIYKTSGEQLAIGRSATQDLGITIEDYNIILNYTQDEGSGTHRIIWDITSSATPLYRWDINTTALIELTTTELRPESNKGMNLGTASLAWDDVYADDYNNVASKQKHIIKSPTEALAIINKISAKVDGQLDFNTLEIAKKYKVREYTVFEEFINKEGKLVSQNFIKRDRVPIDFIEKANEKYEIHHSRSLCENIDLLNMAVKALSEENKELKRIIVQSK